VLADDPRCVFGHCLRAALIVCADATAARSSLAASVVAIEVACPDMHDPARRHAAAARAWLEGDPALAVERYGAIIIDWPRDILALVAAYTLDFHLGQRRMMRIRIAQVLTKWEAAAPGYASVLAMYAFALEENGQYRRAEKVARRALALDPRHPGAIHVVAHVMEMQGRARDGLAFLAAVESAWAEGAGLSVHLAWHRALFYLDANNPEAALATYDAQIATTPASDISALADASAVLWRLQLRKHRGERKMATLGRSLGNAGLVRRATVLCRACGDGVRRRGAHCRRHPRIGSTAAHRHEWSVVVAPGRSAGVIILQSAARLTPAAIMRHVSNGWCKSATSPIAAAAAWPNATSSI
jgi:tetratricopeptide (TPR) repeat protein